MSDKDERIRMRAYYIWERQGGGRAEDHGGEAELEVERELAQQAAQAIGSQDQAKPRTGKRGAASARAVKRPPQMTPPVRVSASSTVTATAVPSISMIPDRQ